MLSRLRTAGLISVTLGLASASAWGAPIITGQIALVGAPSSVEAGATEDDGSMLLFLEREGVLLPTQVAGEITLPTTVADGLGTTPGAVGAGSRVDSYFVHFDTATVDLPITLSGTITFETDILAVMLFGASLDASDSILGAPGSTYPPAGDFFRGTSELTSGGDIVTLSSDRRTLTIQSRVSQIAGFSGIDQLRIVTATVPEPSTAWLIAIGLLGAGLRSRKART